jgi:hypothetical protein
MPFDPDKPTSVRAEIRAPDCRSNPRLASGWHHDGAIDFGLATWTQSPYQGPAQAKHISQPS